MQSALSLLRRARTAHAMTVPKITQLHPGTPVNIVLKADQRTGKLTSGRVADILTKGDHPRGIKVRLGDGRVGRVQSLGEGGPVTVPRQQADVEVASVGELAFARGEDEGYLCAGGDGVRGWKGRGGTTRGWKMQDDVRNDPVPVEERSLDEYMKIPSRNKGKKKRKGEGLAMATATVHKPGVNGYGSGAGGEEEALEIGQGEGGKTTQEQLEGEFPGLDSALVAAIVADHEGLDGARGVLRGLC